MLLKKPPAKLNIKEDIFPANIEPKRVLRNITNRASYPPSIIKVTSEIILARPSLIPGKSTGI